jgi:hypothetical protein
MLSGYALQLRLQSVEVPISVNRSIQLKLELCMIRLYIAVTNS